MPAALPFLTWAFLSLVLLARPAPRPHPSQAALLAAGLTAAYLVAITELLSLFHALSRAPLVILWLAPCLALAILLWTRRHAFRALRFPRGRPDIPTLLLIAANTTILLSVAAIALTTPTVTADCLAYHLPRQFYWAQQHSVAHYPAFDLRQLEMPPFLEFVGTHLAILSRSWAWANVPSAASLFLIAIAAAAVALALGGDRRARALAAFLALTVPATAIQATDAKNDVTVAAWLLALAAVTARVWIRRHLSWRDAATAGLFAGLLILTKGTGYIFAAPFALLLAIAGLRAHAARAIAPGLLAACICLALNAGHFARNLQAFHHPLGIPESEGGYHLANQAFSPAALASNILRNLALHSGGPWPSFNDWQTRQILAFHEWLGISATDARTTSAPHIEFRIYDQTILSGGEPAPVHILLALLIPTLLINLARRRRTPPAAALYAAPIAGWLLFCILLRWQPWHLRLQAPAFVALGAMSGPLLCQAAASWVRIPIAAAAGAFFAFCLAFNTCKPLLGARTIFNTPHADLDPSFQAPILADLKQAAPIIRRLHPRSIGIHLDGATLEWTALTAARKIAGPSALIYIFNPNVDRDSGPEWYRQPPDVVLSWQYKTAPSSAFQWASQTRFHPLARCTNGLFILLPGPPPPPRPR